MYALLRYTVEGAVATITVNDPERRNAVTKEMRSVARWQVQKRTTTSTR